MTLTGQPSTAWEHISTHARMGSGTVRWMHFCVRRSRGENLTAVTHAHVTRILFEGRRAIGVEYVHQHSIKQAFADREVILCGGAINSPQILMLSGVGDVDHLREHGINVVMDLPGVGQNLQDHPLLPIVLVETVEDYGRDYSLTSVAYQEYLRHRSGTFTLNASGIGGFIRTRDDIDLPDVQLYSLAAHASGGGVCMTLSPA